MARILIVDDNKESRDYLHALLYYYDHHVLEASNGKIALEIAKETNIDLIITDILMPVMNGYELVNNLRLDMHLSKIPIIFYTAAYRAMDASVIALSAHVNYVLTKPADINTILTTILNALKTNVELPKKTSDMLNLSQDEVINNRFKPIT